jgi:hypothetical protein
MHAYTQSALPSFSILNGGAEQRVDESPLCAVGGVTLVDLWAGTSDHAQDNAAHHVEHATLDSDWLPNAGIGCKCAANRSVLTW